MRYFVRRADTADILEIEAANASDAALAYARRFQLADGERVIVEGDGTRNFLMACGTLLEEGQTVVVPPPPSPVTPELTPDKAQSVSRAIKRLSAEFTDCSFWIRTLGVAAGLVCVVEIVAAFLLLYRHFDGAGDRVAFILVSVIMMLCGILYGWFSILLFRTASRAYVAAASGAEEDLAASMKNVALFFKTSGILVITLGSIYVVFLFFGLLAAFVRR